jgi:hypothetical protein
MEIVSQKSFRIREFYIFYIQSNNKWLDII